MSQGIVVWESGLVGRMLIAEIRKCPPFELVGVEVSNPNKVGEDGGAAMRAVGKENITGSPQPGRPSRVRPLDSPSADRRAAQHARGRRPRRRILD